MKKTILTIATLTVILSSCGGGAGKSDSAALDSLSVIQARGSAFLSDDKWKIHVEGEMWNKAITTGYKDYVIEVQYLTMTNTLIETRQYTIYEKIKPSDKANLYKSIDDIAPKGSKDYQLKWKLISATPVIDQAQK